MKKLLIVLLLLPVSLSARYRADLDFLQLTTCSAVFTYLCTAGAITTTAGNTLIVTIGRYGTVGTSTVTDDRGDTFVIADVDGCAANTNNSNGSVAVLVASNIAGGSTTVTAANGVGNVLAVTISEYTGNLSIDKCSGAVGSAATADSGNTATTTNANELIYSGIYDYGHIPTVGSGFTIRDGVYDGSSGVTATEDKKVSSTGAYNSTWGSGSINWAVMTVTLYSNSSPPATLPKPLINLIKIIGGVF